MDKAQAINNFWNSFDIPAYDENTVPDDALLPYITYDVATDSFEKRVSLSASLWYRDTSWKRITQKANEIERHIGEHGWQLLKIDNGKVWIMKGSPFYSRMGDPDDSIRRIVINIEVEFLTAY